MSVLQWLLCGPRRAGKSMSKCSFVMWSAAVCRCSSATEDSMGLMAVKRRVTFCGVGGDGVSGCTAVVVHRQRYCVKECLRCFDTRRSTVVWGGERRVTGNDGRDLISLIVHAPLKCVVLHHILCTANTAV